jgi:hypothetical protein
MSSIQERYAQAIRSSNLTCDVNTTFSDLDVIGAMAFADARLSRRDEWGRSRPGACGISRLLAGDDREAKRAVQSVAHRVWARAASAGFDLVWKDAENIAKSCFAWMEHGGCRICAGSMSKRATCSNCDGSGRISFVKGFSAEHYPFAKWAVQEIVADLSVAGAEAGRAIAEQMRD